MMKTLNPYRGWSLKLLKKQAVILLFFLSPFAFLKAQVNIGTSARLDGSSYVNFGFYNFPKNELSVELLFKDEGTVPSYAHFTRFGGNLSKIDFMIQHYSFECRDSALTWATNPYRDQLRDGQWHHIAGVHDGLYSYYYIDGCLVGTDTGGTDLRSSLEVITGISLAGQIDELRIWNGPRTRQELVDNMYNLPNPSSYPDLVGYYKFENNFSNELTGLLGVGTPTGTVTFVPNNTVLVPVLDDFTFTTADVTCANAKDGRVDITSSFPSAKTSLDGINYSSQMYRDTLAPGNYILRLRSQFGCEVAKPFTINDVPNNGLTAFANPNPVCNGQSLNLWATINGNTSGMTFSWSGPSGFSASGQQVNISNTNTSHVGVYTVTATYNNCVTTAQVNVQVGNNPPKPNAGPDEQICELDDIELHGTSPWTTVSYYWRGPQNFTAVTSDATVTRAEPLHSGEYILQTSDGGCLSLEDTVNIIVRTAPRPNLGRDTILCPGDQIQLFPGSFATYYWDDGSANSARIISTPGFYGVDVVDDLGCIGHDDILIREFCKTQVYMPGSFTPDGDGINDIFYLFANNVIQVEMLIFDRWGELIFQSADVKEGWDGKVNGRPVQDGVYVLAVSLLVVNEDGVQERIRVKGSILVIR